jgi:predicted tellurium resistance membrane protein TerC
MAEFFSPENLITLAILTALETVLGFDNLLYISIEAKRVAQDKQQYVRQAGIVVAILLRIVLLFVVLQLISTFQDPLFSIDLPFVHGVFNGHSLIVLAGGPFLIHTAMREIYHMLSVHDLEGQHKTDGTRSVMAALTWIMLMNVVFSFDTVLSAVALTDHFLTMAIAIVASGALMYGLAEHVARFLQRNRMYEVLGLFVLLLVGVMLMSDGGHIAHLAFFGYDIMPIAKSTFYFVVVTLVNVDMIQSRYQRKLDAQRPTGG